MVNLTDELRQAIQQNPEQGVRLRDEQTSAVYVVIDERTHLRAMRALREQEDREAIQAGIDALEAGRTIPLAEADQRIREEFGFGPRTS